MTKEQEDIYNTTDTCWICSNETKEDKVRDHCHITGKYRGAAHRNCKPKLKTPKKLPIIFHNLEGYDGHFIIKALNHFQNIKIEVIPKSTEKYMSIIINKNITFIESMQFLNSSLDTLVKNLEDDDFKHLTSEFSREHLDLLKNKDIYPYEWVDDIRIFNYPRPPPKSAYNSRYNQHKKEKDPKIRKETEDQRKERKEKEYNHINTTWRVFNFKTFKDLDNHYLRKDVLLLAAVFEKFIKTCLKYYSLDPVHYFSAPGLSWDAVLRMTKEKLEKIDNSKMHMFIEHGMRGSVCVAVKEYSKANNEECEAYDRTKKRTEIAYIDMNNLYGKAMMSYLPYPSFKWVKVTDENVKKILKLKDNASYGRFLEVDMYLLDELHDQQNDFSMAAEQLYVKDYMLSKEQREIIKLLNIKIGRNKN